MMNQATEIKTMNPEPEKKKGPPRQFFGPAASPAWEREMNKCIGREVIVRQCIGVFDGEPVWQQYEGVCVAILHSHLSVVLMTPTEKLIVKHVNTIQRKRSMNNPNKPKEQPDVV